MLAPGQTSTAGPPKSKRLDHLKPPVRSVNAGRSNRGRIFSPQAVEAIRELIAQGKSAQEIAVAIGSTAGSVRVKCCQLKMKLPRRSRQSRHAFAQKKLVVYMQPAVRAALEVKASQMQKSAAELSVRLLEAIVGSDLYEAVLDDE